MKKLFTILILSLILTACGNKAQDNKKEEDKNTAQVKDELVLGFGSEPEKGFDPITGWGHYGTSIFQSALLKRDLDLNIVNDLAKEYSLSEDKLTYNVTLRDDVKWSDGEKFTAKDVEFTYNLAKEKNAPGSNLSRLASAKATGDYTIELKLDKPDISFVSSMCSLPIVPEHAYDEKTYGSNPIGTGPYKMVEWKVGQQLIIEPNENYYGEKSPFKKITFLFFKDTDASLATAKEKVCDVIRVPYTAHDINVEGYHIESLDTVDNRGISMPMEKNTGKVTGDETLAPGSPIGNNVTSDIAIRKALNIAIDRKKIIDEVLDGQGSVASSIADGMPWFNEETRITNDGDIEGAKKILAEGGWKLNDKGILEKDGVEAKFNLYLAYKDREDIALQFAKTAKELGIEVNVEYGDWDAITPHMYSDAIFFGWGGYDPLEMYYNYSGTMVGREYYNANYYDNKTVNEHFEKGLSATSAEGLNEEFKKAQFDGQTGLSSLGDCPWIWILNENHLYLVRDDLDIGKQKIQPHGGGWPIVDTISNWKWK
ncbi:peptide/nickel transport system substrate-binding protein [Peptoniphilus koenoeneniae]|uniref:Peptide/nickel transport system substrate-binding protein n=1 Tax=Peptoniphilus koenoeneniae TaxID=507751 RepID=A0ABU0AW04_9FIRM|nr:MULTISPECIES: ABC transporter substrate-binding protein [Peptoniphilus]ERT57474.1 ABC transporter, substrate-binding protein, family 5 [Peptoniphilus sp. BV3C26]MDQ0275441.1 peptide/nickel transport system substrate-binding protein [Peptoniphilus koenoeneniae]